MGAVCLLTGLAGGLSRIGADTPSPTTAAAGHGVLMVLGFLGTLIALERAVALRRRWGYLAPALAGVGGIAILVGVPAPVPALVMATAGAWLVAGYVVMWQVQPTLHIAVQALGGIAWWAGAVAWLRGAELAAVTPWLVVFLVLTIAGERLELARVAWFGQRHVVGVTVWSGLIFAGPVVATWLPALGGRILGVGLVVLSLWLWRFDIAPHTVRASGLTRYMAVCLLFGYVWILVAGVIWLWNGDLTEGASYDAGLHAVFLGFVMSMVLGHAPVILPAVLRVRLPHHPRDYAVLALLQVSVVVRLVGGDLFGNNVLLITGGALGVLALLAFVVNAASSAVGAGLAGRTQARTYEGTSS
jgi:hypothetical protein